MKKILLAAVALLMPTMMLAKSYQIKGTLKGDTEGKTVYLLKSGTDEMSLWRPQPLDSTIVKGGQFIFKGKLDEPTLLLIKYYPSDNRADMENGRVAMRPVLPLYIDGGKINIVAHVDSMQNDFETAAYGTYDYKDAVITGSPLNDLYREYKQGFTDYNNRLSELLIAFNRYYYNNEDKATMDYVVRELARQDSAKAEEQAFLKDFISRNGDNLAGVLAFNEKMGRFDKAGIESLTALISDKMKITPQGQATLLKADTIKSTANGAMFADVTLNDPDGKSHKLSEYLGKGNYTLLEFWASWCGPCRGSIPHLKQVYGLYKPLGFDIVSVSMDTDNKAWHKALGEERMSWTQLVCADGFGEVAKIYNFNGIPYCVLIGPDGKVIETNCRGPRLNRQLCKLYGNKLEEFHLTAQLDELKDSVTIVTVEYGSFSPTLKKYPLKDGKLDLRMKLDKPMQMSLTMPNDYSHGVSLPAINGEEATVTGSFKDFTIGGSNFYQEYKEANDIIAPSSNKLNDLRMDYETLYNQLKDSKKKKEQQRLADAREHFATQYDSLATQLKADVWQYVKTHPRSEASVAMLSIVEQDSLESAVKGLNYYVANGRMKPVIEALQKQAENERIRKEAKEGLKPGVEAPDFTLDDINGKPFTLSSMRGKWVILDFWGSWCGWCIKGMPEMKKYYEKYKGKFEIVGIDCNDTVEKWKKAVKDNDLPWLHVYNKAADGTPDKYGVEGYPTKLIIDPEGKINKIIVGEDPEFYNYLDELFK